MKPVLFQLGPIQVYAFGLMIAAGVLLSLCLMLRESGRGGFPRKEEVYDLVFVALLTGFLGGRLAYVFENFEWYARHPLQVFALWEGGLIFYGGVIGSLLGLVFFCRRRKIGYPQALDFLIPYVALTHAFGRAGCFLNGCCLGSVCDLPWAVHFPGEAFARHPAQIYEALANLGLFLFLRQYAGRKRFHGEVILLYLMLYAVIRFIIEIFREGYTLWAVFTLNQWISIAVLAVCGILYSFLLKRSAGKKKEEGETCRPKKF